jgi:sugar-phosphatase
LAFGFGGSPEHAVRQLLPHLDGLAVAAAAARQLALQYDDLSDIARTPGTTAFLTALDQLRLPWAVVTSADMRLARGRLDAVAIHAPLIITMEDVAEGKPHPDCYILAAAELGVAPSHCLVVEDTEPGVAAGRSAGATVAALKGVPGDLSVHDLGELVHLIMEAWNRTE